MIHCFLLVIEYKIINSRIYIIIFFAIFSFIFYLSMTESFFIYISLTIITFLVVFGFVMWIEKVIKILLGNYLLILLILATNQSLLLLINFLEKTPTFIFAGFSYESLAYFFSNAKMTILLLLYVWFFFLIYYKSKIRILLPGDDIIQKILHIILVPLTVIWIIFSFLIIFFWISLFSPNILTQTISFFPQNTFISSILYFMPVFFLIHALLTILLTSEIKIQIKTDV